MTNPQTRPWRERGDRWYCSGMCREHGCDDCDWAEADENGPHPGTYVGYGTVIEQCLAPIPEDN